MNSIQNLESFMIADEGYNHDTRKEIKTNKTYEELRNLIKETAKLSSKGFFTGNLETLTKANANLEKMQKLATKLKTEIDKLPEPETMVDRLMGNFTVILIKLDLKELIYMPSHEYKTNGVTNSTITYHDSYSDKTSSHVKKDYQYKMNFLLYKYIPSTLRTINMSIARVKKKADK